MISSIWILIFIGLVLIIVLFWRYLKRVIFIIVLLILSVVIYGFFNPEGKTVLLKALMGEDMQGTFEETSSTWQAFSAVFLLNPDAEIVAIMQMMNFYVKNASDVPSDQIENDEKEISNTSQVNTKKSEGNGTLTPEEIAYTQWLFETITEEF